MTPAWVRRHPDRAVTLVLAVVTYVPMLLTRPGRVSADTKSYLTIDPGDVVSNAATMWDPSVGAGTVPHQNIGYLFPLGPYYWLMERVAVPDWLTQRLLWATMVFAAAVGTYRLARWMGWRVGGSVVAAAFYAFSPYLLSYLARLSVILAPWAAMPWMILLAARAARTRSWRPAAAFALVVALVGSVNATSLVFAGLAPMLWLVADVVSGRVGARAAGLAAAKIGALTAGVSAWWIAGLSVQGAYGLPILRYTETYQAVAGASTPNEILRGLGYWFFYGGDRLDAWVGPSPPYINNPFLMTLGFTIAGLALLGLLARFPGRAFAALLLLTGLAISVGAAPLGDSTLYGVLFERLATDNTVGQALRSTPRAAPLVILALAFGAGAGVEWLRERVAATTGQGYADLVPLAAVALVAVQLFPWFTGTALTPSLLRDETLPAYETELASWLDSTGTGRVYELPGADFANHRWGGTVDPVLPGLIDRPYLARELVPLGGAGTADLLNAFERRLAEGWFEPESLAPIAALFDVETVVTRNDLEHERYRLARPGPLWTDIVGALGAPDHAGPATTDRTVIPLIDGLTLARPDAAESFPSVAAFDLGDAPTVSVVPAAAPLVVAGSGDGLVDLAGAGLLAGLLEAGRPVLYSATLDRLAVAGELDPAALGDDPWWVVTDTNRKRGRHWSTIGSNRGALEADGPLWLVDDPGDNDLDVFGDRRADQTVAVHRGDVADVRASYYGNRIAYTPEDAPHFALDGDPATAWRAGVFDETAGLRWVVELRAPVDPGSVTLLQPTTGATNRFITEARITLDGGEQDGRSLDVALDERSRAVPGQPVELPGGTFTAMTIEVLADNVGALGSYAGQPGVGLAEVTLPGVADDRVVRMPDLADTALLPDGVPADQRLTYVMTRQRIDPATPNRTAPEPALDRQFATQTARTFRLTGEARLSAAGGDALLASVLGDGELAIADRRLPGVPAARGASSRDGDERTAWQTPFGDSTGAALTIEHAAPIAADEMTIAWFDDGRHSTPSALTLANEAGDVRRLGVVADATRDGIATATIAIPGYAAATSTITVSAIDQRTSPEYFSGVPLTLPLGIAEVRFPGERREPRATAVDTGCRDDLVELDGEPLAARVEGSRETALDRGELRLTLCAASLDLGAGAHLLRTAPGAATGFDIDRLVLDSDGPTSTPTEGAVPDVVAGDRGATRLDVTVGSADDHVWLTLNQSWNAGWRATVDGADLGRPVLVDGYANGWLLAPSAEPRTVELEWTPQRRVRVGLWLSALSALVVLALLAWPRRDRPPPAPAGRRWIDPSGPALAAGLVIVLFVVGGPAAAAGALLVALLGGRWPRLVPAAVLAAGVVASAPVVVLERLRNFSDGPDWPSQFAWAAPFAWFAVATVIAGAVVGHPLRLGAARPPGDGASGG